MSAKRKLDQFLEDDIYEPAPFGIEIPDDIDDDLAKWLREDDQTILSQAAQNVPVEVQNGTGTLPQGVQSTTRNYSMRQNFDISQIVPQDNVQRQGLFSSSILQAVVNYNMPQNPNLLSPDMNINMSQFANPDILQDAVKYDMSQNFDISQSVPQDMNFSMSQFSNPDIRQVARNYMPQRFDIAQNLLQDNVHHLGTTMMPYVNSGQMSIGFSNSNNLIIRDMNFSMPEFLSSNHPPDMLMPYTNFSQTSTRFSEPITKFLPYHHPDNYLLRQNQIFPRQHHPHGNFLPISSPGPFHVPAHLIPIPGHHNFQQYDTDQNFGGNVLQNVRPKRQKQGLVLVAEPREEIIADNVLRYAENDPGRMRVVVELSPNLNGSKFDVWILDKSSINTLKGLLVKKGKLQADEKCLFSHNRRSVLKPMDRGLRSHGVKDGDSIYVFQAQEDARLLYN